MKAVERLTKQRFVQLIQSENPQRRVKDLNPTLTETVWKCDSSQNLRLRRGATGVVGRGGAADPHGRTERSGVNSSRPISGRSRGIKFACDGTARFGTCDQNGEAAGLAPAVLHVSAQLDGRNEWFSGGWTGNEYREWSRVELRGPQSGWVLADGELDVGSGNYRT